uniref:Uncharacterized protein n=1 Tax=Romanomermis culicivorax TaxID=13658 RepID=A0A915JV31_ROMCU
MKVFTVVFCCVTGWMDFGSIPRMNIIQIVVGYQRSSLLGETEQL